MTNVKNLRIDKFKSVMITQLFFPTTLLYLELLFRFCVYGFTIDMGYIYMPIFTFSIGFLISALCGCFSKKINRILTIALTFTTCAYYIFHFMYYKVLKGFFMIVMVQFAGDAAADFWQIGVLAVLRNFWFLLLGAIPFAFVCLFHKRLFCFEKTVARLRIAYIIISVLFYLFNIVIINFNSGEMSDKYYYTSALSPGETITRFGLATTSRLDLQHLFIDIEDDEIINPYTESPDALMANKNITSGESTTQKEYGKNVTDIDFDTLIANEDNEDVKEMHEYFKTVTPTSKNEYTGYFKEKNVIYMTLEGFSDTCVSKELTPTLYKMLNTGFVFENYYNSLWGGSTASGEYANLTGNFYTTADCLQESSENYMPYAVGNAFKSAGYSAYAYHDHTGTYYHRDQSHTNMGFTFKAIEMGLDGMTDAWPRSDNEMASLTLPDYVDDTPFCAYYMTVSGHGYYSWSSNAMSTKHYDRVKDLPYSENAKAYIACNLEVEDMLNTLIAQLEAKGILDDTVFVMNADHYPYLLEDSELAELYGLDKDGIRDNLELYRNGLIIWSSSMTETVKITKPCSSIDVLPTVLNLFDIEYDSRLIMGTDILSSTDPVAIINCLGSGGSWHWRTSVGTYNTKTGEFTPNEGVKMTEDEIDSYVTTVNRIVQLKRKYSAWILDYDYYGVVFQGKEPKVKS